MLIFFLGCDNFKIILFYSRTIHLASFVSHNNGFLKNPVDLLTVPCMLKYLGVKYLVICVLLSDGSAK